MSDVLKVSPLSKKIDNSLRLKQLDLYKADKRIREREGIETDRRERSEFGNNVDVRDKYSTYLKRKRSNMDSAFVGIQDERTRYFKAPLAAPETNVLEFWKSNEYNFPILSAMAKDYLTVQATSVPSERAFSSGTDLITANRCSMAGTTIEKTQFLKLNL
ncbi:hypothetical protein MP638_000551 [Amoeboaphelidium occidentale]|nr:hypothetical protein MP638_000551 [Amoeboaphelidium occidentale]